MSFHAASLLSFLLQVKEINISYNSILMKGGGAVYADRDSSSAAFDELLYNVGIDDDHLNECPVNFGAFNVSQAAVRLLFLFTKHS